MAYAFADLPAAELAAFNRDISLAVPRNELQSTTLSRWSQGGEVTDADESAVGFPASRSFDEFPHKITKPATDEPIWFLVFRFPSPGVTVDSTVVIPKNIETINSPFNIEIADDGAFATNLITIVSTGAVTAPAAGKLDSRFGFFDLNHAGSGSANPQRYTSVEFLRIKFGPFPASVPEIHQVIVGQRSQLLEAPLVPHTSSGNRTAATTFESRAGVGSVDEEHRGRGEISANFITADAAEFAPIDDWWDRTDEGFRHFIWAAQPKTKQNDALFVRFDPRDFFFPELTSRVRQGSFDMIEQGPPFRERET